MIDKEKTIKAFAAIAATVLLAQAAPAYAGWGREDRHHVRRYYSVHRHYPRPGKPVVVLPLGSITVVIGGSKYYHCDGVFYQRYKQDYVVVAPPRGVYIKTLPSRYRQIRRDGQNYFECDGIYYKYIPGGGYEVISLDGDRDHGREDGSSGSNRERHEWSSY